MRIEARLSFIGGLQYFGKIADNAAEYGFRCFSRQTLDIFCTILCFQKTVTHQRKEVVLPAHDCETGLYAQLFRASRVTRV